MAVRNFQYKNQRQAINPSRLLYSVIVLSSALYLLCVGGDAHSRHPLCLLCLNSKEVTSLLIGGFNFNGKIIIMQCEYCQPSQLYLKVSLRTAPPLPEQSASLPDSTSPCSLSPSLTSNVPHFLCSLISREFPVFPLILLSASSLHYVYNPCHLSVPNQCSGSLCFHRSFLNTMRQHGVEWQKEKKQENYAQGAHIP